MLVGKGVSDGIGLGKVVILKENELKIEKQKIEDISAEKQLVYNAIKEVENEIEDLIQNISGTEKEIMQAYLMILQDPNLTEEIIKIIEQEKCNSLYAVETGLNKIIKTFEEMDDPYMSARSRDIEDMKKRILSKMLNIKEIDLSKLPENTLSIALKPIEILGKSLICTSSTSIRCCTRGLSSIFALAIMLRTSFSPQAASTLLASTLSIS